MSPTLIKSQFKPDTGIPNGDSVRFVANNPAPRKKLNNILLRLGAPDKPRDMTQTPPLKGVETMKATTSTMNWFLTLFDNPYAIVR